MISSMMWLSLLAFMASCTSTTVTVEPGAVEHRFSTRPFDEDWPASQIDPQKGDFIGNTIQSDQLVEVTIAQGSGFLGFDTLRLSADGTGDASFAMSRSQKPTTNIQVDLTLTEKEMAGLIAALNADQAATIEGGYSADIHDGVQGFLELKTQSGRRYCWLNNHFAPVANTYVYCNKVIWPKVAGTKIVARRIDSQAEFHRVFQPGHDRANE